MNPPCGEPILWGISPDFSGLSPCYRWIAYVLLTRAPVADKGIATSSLPLDLHVLGLSLAFILSQDQTLRCMNLFVSLSARMVSWKKLPGLPRYCFLCAFVFFYAFNVLCSSLLTPPSFAFKDRLALSESRQPPGFVLKSSAKILPLIFPSKLFNAFF